MSSAPPDPTTFSPRSFDSDLPPSRRDDSGADRLQAEPDSASTRQLCEAKARLRTEAIARRASLNEAARARAAWSLLSRLELWVEETPLPEAVAIYIGRPSEVSLDSLIAALRARGARVGSPRVEACDVEAPFVAPTSGFFELPDDLDDLELGPWGVQQPPADAPPLRPGLVFCPGLAFDCAGRRLGFGSGWYDRTLAALEPGAVFVGISFEAQIVAHVPTAPHDIAMHHVFTELRHIRAPQPIE